VATTEGLAAATLVFCPISLAKSYRRKVLLVQTGHAALSSVVWRRQGKSDNCHIGTP
jgi:hypothetical protein